MIRRLALVAAVSFFLPFGCSAAWAQGLHSRFEGLPLPWPEPLDKLMRTPAMEAKGEHGARLHYIAIQDADIVRDWLRSEGFLDAVVKSDNKEDKPVHWHVTPGSRWQIGEVVVDPAPPGSIGILKSGAWFRSEDYEAAKVALRGAWTDAGYLRFSFTESAVYPDHHNKTVRIVWHTVPGALQHIRSVDVTGANQYHPDLARRLSLLAEGDVPTARAIRAAVRNISSNSHYRTASVIPALPDEAGDEVPVRVEVVEAARYVVSGTAGYSTDSGPAATADWSDRGIAGGQLEYGVHGKWSKTSSGAGMTLSRPVWPGMRDTSGVSLDYLREDTAGQRSNTISGGPFWLHQFGDLDHVRLQVQQNWITGVGEHIRTVEPALSLHMDRRNGEGVLQHGWKADISMSLPLQTNGAGRWFVSRVNLRSFHLLGKYAMASPRIGYGRTVSLKGAVPKSMRQYAGGSGSVRGYKLESLGPIGPDGLAQGGLQSANAGLDLVWKMSDTFLPVLFADTGQVWNTPQSREKPVWSIGLGLIAQTPAGPLRADLAFPQSRRPQDSPFQFYISLGDVF